MPASQKSGNRWSARHNERASVAGAGAHFTSPLKAGAKRNRSAVRVFGQENKIKALRERIDAAKRKGQNSVQPVEPPPSREDVADFEGDVDMHDWVDEDSVEPPPRPLPHLPPILVPIPESKTQSAAQKLCTAWDVLLPTLTEPLTQYLLANYAQPPSIIPSVVRHQCTVSCGVFSTFKVQCLYISHFQQVQVETCSCVSVPVLLVQNGVFPMSPTQPRTGVSIDLLDIYRALFERSCDAITALAAALHTIYDRRGFHVLSQKNPGQLTTDPFRAGLQQAVQWYSNLRTRLQAKVDAALAAADVSLFPRPPASIAMEVQPPADTSATPAATPADTSATPAATPADTSATPAATPADMSATPADIFTTPPVVNVDGPAPPFPSPNPVSIEPEQHTLTPGRADRILRERCPACFNLEEWGRPLEEGGDVQLGADGCFSYRHARKAGDGPISYDPAYFLSKEKVDKIGDRIADARKKKPSKCTPRIPEEVIDACEASWDAANEKKKKVDTKCHDASGVFVMTCRHSQVLFQCNIDTPGEQQKYIVALMEEVISLLPPQATVLQAYDVGCVTDHSFNLYPILSQGIRERVAFVINAMHAYGHQWVCQLVYSPRLRRGMCLTDSEGVERFWSRIRKLIGITRHQWNSRRIWMIDQYTAFVNEDGRDSLGDWMHRQREINLTRKYNIAHKVIRECRVSVEELRRQWDDQKAAQMSIRARKSSGGGLRRVTCFAGEASATYAPVRLRRELDKVLALQTQIEVVEQSIHDAKQSIAGADASADSLILLRGLENTHQTLSIQAERLYASLNIHESFPELKDLPLEFVRTLLMMRDLKMNIRKRAIGSFSEWDSLDRAVGGKRESLGTKLHQATRKAISKRQPALLRSITKFNTYCAELEEQRPEGCPIPIPSPLSTQLNGLRNDPSLYEDVWITPSAGQIPRWLDDVDVRDGIRSLHVLDRCFEEQARLQLECTNMSRWLSEELAIVSRAIESLDDPTLELALHQRLTRLKHLQATWNPVLQRGSPSSIRPLLADQSAAIAQPLADTSAAARIRAPLAVSFVVDTPEGVFAEDESVVASDMMVSPEELDPGTMPDPEETLIVEDMILNDEEEESSAVEADSMQLEIKWEPPPNLSEDSSLLQDLQARNLSLETIQNQHIRTVVSNNGRPKLQINACDWQRISSPTGRLNNFGLNGLAASFLNIYGHPHSPTAASANHCAVFSTYNLHHVRYKVNDDYLWRAVQPTAYWGKPIWLVPIHRKKEEHWVFVVLFVREQRIFFFDSFAQRCGWRQDLQDIMVFITRLTVLANRNNHPLHLNTEEDPWIAQPLFHQGQPRQSNGYDCGLWVLCMMAAILRGYHVTAITEREMAAVRRIFTDHILTLPFT
ncbi:hypothetical protein MVEN_02148700 [Mycena venus]|uniref:Ubiquitin-like protease family profile domain-containing protein n=1 Tax=Mycena venus TaxID=2733690 RepID=A0A8H6XAR5_9AGAR|nr:hypothetical protein MVEN_02148700 [Mycena venus]